MPRQRQRRRYELSEDDLNRRVEELVSLARGGASAESAEIARQMLVTALRVLGDAPDIGDARLLNNALKELRHALRVFAPYAGTRKVAVFGSARTREAHPDYVQAERFAEAVVRRGWMVITGAGGGIMHAAQGGAGRDASFGVNIRLPFEQAANDVIAGDKKLINFRYFFTRKVSFVRQAHAIALFPGGFGTHDEGFEALTLIQTGKSEILPVVFVDAPGGDYWRDWVAYLREHLLARRLIDENDLGLFRVTDDVDQAVDEITGFYRNYHSSRYVKDVFVMRVRRAPDAAELAALNDDFADIVSEGVIEVREALPEEGGAAPSLARVVLRFDRRSVGRLRQLIDRLNQITPDAADGRDASFHQIVPQELPPEAESEEAD